MHDHMMTHRRAPSPRDSIVLNLDQDLSLGLWSAAIRAGRFKLIWGQSKLLKQKVGVTMQCNGCVDTNMISIF